MLSSKEIRRFLACIKPFAALPSRELDRVASHAVSRRFLDGETVYEESAAAESIWIVHQGRVVVFKNAPLQGRFPIESLGPGEVFGAFCRLGEDSGKYPCSALAAGKATIIRLPERSFFEPYDGNSAFARQACALCSVRLAITLTLRNVDQAPVETRVAHTLARLHRVYGATIPLTKRELAELVGSALETTFRALAKLQRQGVVFSSRGRIEIKKPERLTAS